MGCNHGFLPFLVFFLFCGRDPCVDNVFLFLLVVEDGIVVPTTTEELVDTSGGVALDTPGWSDGLKSPIVIPSVESYGRNMTEFQINRKGNKTNRY